MNFDSLFEDLSFRTVRGDERKLTTLEITDVVTTPEEAGASSLFVATRTPLHDGHRFVFSAYERGCRLFLCEREVELNADAVVLVCKSSAEHLFTLASRVYGHPERHLTLVGITGSEGKTSLALALASFLCAKGARVASLTSDGLCTCGSWQAPDPIVPDAAKLCRYLRDMVKNGVEYAILEFSAYQLSLEIVSGLSFAVVVHTGLSPRHIGENEFENIEALAAAKARLLLAESAISVLPVGLDVPTASRTVRVGEGGDFFASAPTFSLGGRGVIGSHLTVFEREASWRVFLPVTAEYAPTLAAFLFAVLRALDFEAEEIAAECSRLQGTGRMECAFLGEDCAVYIDSAYEAADIERALSRLAPLTKGRLCALLGAVGGRARYRRAEIGRVLYTHADFAYLTADHPGEEDVAAICEEIRAGMRDDARSCVIEDRESAIERAVRELRRGDILLLLGKGNEPYQLVRGERLPYSEREALRLALLKMRR